MEDGLNTFFVNGFLTTIITLLLGLCNARYLSTLDVLNDLNCWIFFVNDAYIEDGLNTLFVKWFLINVKC